MSKRKLPPWYPKLREFVLRYAMRDSENIDRTAGCAFTCLIVFTVGAAIFWATGRINRGAQKSATPPARATPASKMTRFAPDSTPRPISEKDTPSTPTPPSTPIATEAEGRAEALRMYPALGIADSPINVEFVARYKRYREEKPEFFDDPAWPVTLVRECATALGEDKSQRVR